MLELYIFNKESPNKDGLTFWDKPTDEPLENSLTYNLDRFKFKDSSLHVFPELAQELNYFYKENEVLKKFFEKHSSTAIQIKLVDNYHHLVCYEPRNRSLILDSKIQAKLSPLYLFAIYYTFARETKDEDEIFKTLPEFFWSFELKVLETLATFFDRDKKGPCLYDAGGHFFDFIQYLIELKQRKPNYEDLSFAEKSDIYLKTQLFRNRSLAGKLPYDIFAFANVLSKHTDDPFGAQAMTELYDSVKESYDEVFSRKYYRHLCQSLEQIGLGVVAQRGSRVAHEQGPILINSGLLDFTPEFEIKIKKFRSSVVEAVSKVEESLIKHFDNRFSFAQPLTSLEFNVALAKISLDIDLNISSLVYFCESKNIAKSRFERALIELRNDFSKFFAEIFKEIERRLTNDASFSKESFWAIYDQLKNQEKHLVFALIEIEDTLKQSPITKKKAVVYIQRPSSRSGHFIPRIILGQNLYIETDEESEKHRLKAIPYNFVSPEYIYVSDGIDAFFENASISVVTDRKTGDPYIKWENAEDLAISLAPGMYKSIKAAQEEGRNFHYQLETTLFGPLIELFLVLLENEISNIATIERHNIYKSSQLTISDLQNLDSGIDLVAKNPELEKILESYKSEILESSAFVFSYYLLEDELEQYKLTEGLDEFRAISEMILNLRDVQSDLAKYCLLKRKDPTKFNAFKTFATELIQKSLQSQSVTEQRDLVKTISDELSKHISNIEAKSFIKKYVRYPESTACKEYLEKNAAIQKIIVTCNKNIKDADYYFDFTVAPSRIDFGKHVVASITTLMGRILGADDYESLEKGKEYIDLVSKSRNNFFESASEAGSVKVLENTCRALQYSKAISFQGAFQSFAIDGAQARMTINSRNTKAAGLHIMEYGTMASTGYCITKEPLFILLAYSIDSDSLFDKLGIEDKQVQAELKDFFKNLLKSKASFASSIDWEISAYEEMASSPLVKKYLSDSEYSWLPNLKSLIALIKHLSDYGTEDELVSKTYSGLAAKLIEFGRIINETGIVQRIQIMNSAIRRANINQNFDKNYEDLIITLNASYKGNVSDERENANQYLIALLLQQKQYIKNVSIPEIETLVDYQIKKYSLPKEIRVFDPFVDKEIFMGGELKTKAEDILHKLVALEFKTPLSREIIEACVLSYGSDYSKWRIFDKRFSELDTVKANDIKAKISGMQAEIKYLEIYLKGFFKDYKLAYQGVDVIQLNSDHDELIKMLQNLPLLKSLMQINNDDSLLVLVDNPQQAKKPFLDFDRSLEWMALGGTIASHLIAEEKYEEWRKDINSSCKWAKLYLQKLIYDEKHSEIDLRANADYQKICEELLVTFNFTKRYADLKRDLILQKYYEAEEMNSPFVILRRYQEIINCYSRVKEYVSYNELDFIDWLILGGRWLLNGQNQSDIDFAMHLFENRKNQNHKSSKKMHEAVSLLVKAFEVPDIERKNRIIKNAGSTKEADLVVTSASENIELRIKEKNKTKNILIKQQEFQNFDARIRSTIDVNNYEALEQLWESNVQEYVQLFKSNKADAAELYKSFAKILKILELYGANFISYEPSLKNIINDFVKLKLVNAFSLIPVFGDHKATGGVFQALAQKLSMTGLDQESMLDKLAKLGEMFVTSYLIYLVASIEDENELINNLGIFFDQYINVHEEDYPPYMFHSICAGASFGFNQTYYLDTNLRTKMFKLACRTGIYIYKISHYLLSHKSILKYTSQEYKDALIGDYENGIIPIGYQHETICIEERLWDCMKSLRNFVRNYHDRHPLPIIVKGKDATVDQLFRYKLEDEIDLCWIAGISNIGKHSWDLNCVFRSPLLRNRVSVESGQKYINVSVFTPYLTNNGEIKQIYTSFKPEVFEEQMVNYIAPFKPGFNYDKYNDPLTQGWMGAYALNYEGFVHALVMLDPGSKSLPRPSVTMSAHTHPQYISNFVRDLGVPETWSMLSMLQMYSKTEVPKILAEVNMEAVAQIEFYQKEFNDKASIQEALRQRLQAQDVAHIDFWILKASKESGGRGISSKLNVHNDLEEIVDFIFQKTKTDDVVMQEFVPNNAKSFINADFARKIEDTFIESGIAIDRITPYEQLYFAMRSFQSITGIKGYLFSVNLGNVTVNAGQGAKLFYGEPIYIMPIYIAGKIQNLLDEHGEMILKEAIPKHAEKFARANNISVVNNNLGTTNCYMFNGLFDYIPFAYALRADQNSSLKKFKIICEENPFGGLDYYYSYYGQRVIVASGKSHQESLDQFEKILKDSVNGDLQGRAEQEIDIDLAKIEFNSGLGQANLLQKAVESMAPENKDLFLEWTMDLGTIGMAAKAKVK